MYTRILELYILHIYYNITKCILRVLYTYFVIFERSQNYNILNWFWRFLENAWWWLTSIVTCSVEIKQIKSNRVQWNSAYLYGRLNATGRIPLNKTNNLSNFFLNNQTDALIIPILFSYKTLHVSGILSAHHQEFSTVHSALASFVQV